MEEVTRVEEVLYDLLGSLGIFDSSTAVLGMAYTPPPRIGDSVLYCGDELCTA